MADEIALAVVRSVADNLTQQTNVNAAAIRHQKSEALVFLLLVFHCLCYHSTEYGAGFSTVK